MRIASATSPLSERFAASPRALLAVAALLLAALLPGLHGLSLGGHVCSGTSCRDSARTTESPRPAAEPAVRRARTVCACGHDHGPESAGSALAAAPVAHTPDVCDDPAPPPPPPPHDHRDCPICKIIFAGANRIAANTAPAVLILAAQPAGLACQSRTDAPRVFSIYAAFPRGPPAHARA